MSADPNPNAAALDRDIDSRLAELSLDLFATIKSQTSDDDKHSLLACQVATRSLIPGYRYLEIGSYLGGAIQPHLVDPLCAAIYSIDKRPQRQPDNSGLTIRFPDNTTERMLEHLRRVPGGDLNKLTCFEGTTSQLNTEILGLPVNLCFIDGEHTDEAVLADFEFCLKALEERGAVIFHDSQITYIALAKVIDSLSTRGIPFHAYNLPDVLMVIEVGDFPLHQHPLIADMLIDNYVGYLASLRRNDHFRRWANLQPLRTVRKIKARLEGTDLSE